MSIICRISNKLLFIIVCGGLLLFVSCNNNRENVTAFFKLPNGVQTERLSLEVAYTQSMRTLGLMYRHQLDKNKGMLFVFPDNAQRNFWMKNTPIPLDIIYIDAEQKIVHIAADTKPYSESEIPSIKPAKYVVELNAGRAAELGLTESCILVIEGHVPNPS